MFDNLIPPVEINEHLEVLLEELLVQDEVQKKRVLVALPRLGSLFIVPSRLLRVLGGSSIG